jgi:hypothetical protein
MKKLIIPILLILILFVGCGTPTIVVKEKIDMPWGSFDLLAGWKIETRDGDSITLSNIDEQHLKISFKVTENPTNKKTWATNHAISTGRTPKGSGKKNISGETIETFITNAQIGKSIVEETLYMIPFNEKIISVVATKPIESSMGFHLTQILDGIEVKK